MKRFKLLFLSLLILFLILFYGQFVEPSAILVYKVDTKNSSNYIDIKTNIIRDSNAVLEIETTKLSICKFSRYSGLSYDSMEGSFDFSYNTFHKLDILNLADGTYTYYIRCKDFEGSLSGEIQAVFGVNLPVAADIKLSENTPLKSGTINIDITTSKTLSSSPTLSYTYDESTFRNLPVVGNGKQWKSYIIIPNDAGEKIGSFRFSGKDLEGFSGSEIKSGGIFLVDTIPPKIIRDFSVEGYDLRIELNFHTDEKINKFNIYKSTIPGVTKSNYHKQITDDTYIDTDVDRGKTYYYKVSAIDTAGNEGELSVEGYSTVLLSDSSSVSSSGLDLKLHGTVDNFITEIDSFKESVDKIKLKYDGDNKDSEIFTKLKLDKEIDSSLSEINSLKREVSDYKNQNMNQNDLNNKINSARIKLNSIKKNSPESVVIVDESIVDNLYDNNDVLSIILSVNPDLNDVDKDKLSKRILADKNNYEFSVKRSGYNLEIVYMDGNRDEISLIIERINSLNIDNENISILESIPKEIATSVLDLEIKNNNYDAVKEDTIISFNKDNKEIIYEINDQIELSYLSNIKTILYNDHIDQQKNSLLSGYSISTNMESTSFYGIITGIIIVMILFTYFINVRSKRIKKTKLEPLFKLINETSDSFRNGNTSEAFSLYNSISNSYKLLNDKEKKMVYPSIEKLTKEMKLI